MGQERKERKFFTEFLLSMYMQYLLTKKLSTFYARYASKQKQIYNRQMVQTVLFPTMTTTGGQSGPSPSVFDPRRHFGMVGFLNGKSEPRPIRVPKNPSGIRLFFHACHFSIQISRMSFSNEWTPKWRTFLRFVRKFNIMNAVWSSHKNINKMD